MGVGLNLISKYSHAREGKTNAETVSVAKVTVEAVAVGQLQ